MRKRVYRPVKLPQVIAGAVLFAVLVSVALTAMYARSLLIQVLDGSVKSEQETRVTPFSLREQMMKSQADTRVRGWLSIAQKEEVLLETKRGTLRAGLFEPVGGSEDAPWALVVHGGLGTDRTQILDIACELALSDYHVLTPDLHAHGASDGEVPSLGLMDAQDIGAWVRWIISRDADAQIVLFGQDEGGTGVLLAAAQGLPPQVCAAAADSAYASVSERLLDLLYRQSVEESSLKSLLIHAAFRAEHGISAKDGNLMELLSSCGLPLLLLHGTGDEDVPAWHGEDMAAAAPDAELVFIEGSTHGKARYAEPEKYYEALLGFYREKLRE